MVASWLDGDSSDDDDGHGSDDHDGHGSDDDDDDGGSRCVQDDVTV